MPHDGVKIRKFEPGASGMGLDGFLQNLGYKIHGRADGGTFRVTGPNGGRAKTMHRSRLMELLDQERVKAGLQPIKARAPVEKPTRKRTAP